MLYAPAVGWQEEWNRIHILESGCACFTLRQWGWQEEWNRILILVSGSTDFRWRENGHKVRIRTQY